MAVLTDKANEQHYEVPAEFYRYALGKNFKYSCCYYESANGSGPLPKTVFELTCSMLTWKVGTTSLNLVVAGVPFPYGWQNFPVPKSHRFPIQIPRENT